MNNEFLISDSGSESSIELEGKISKLYLDINAIGINNTDTKSIYNSDIIVTLFDKHVLVESFTYPYHNQTKVVFDPPKFVQYPNICLKNSKGISLDWKIHVKLIPGELKKTPLDTCSFSSYLGKNTSFSFDIPDTETLLFKIYIRFNKIPHVKSCILYYHLGTVDSEKCINMTEGFSNDVVFLNAFDVIENTKNKRRIFFHLKLLDTYHHGIDKIHQYLHVVCELAKVKDQ